MLFLHTHNKYSNAIAIYSLSFYPVLIKVLIALLNIIHNGFDINIACLLTIIKIKNKKWDCSIEQPVNLEPKIKIKIKIIKILFTYIYISRDTHF